MFKQTIRRFSSKETIDMIQSSRKHMNNQMDMLSDLMNSQFKTMQHQIMFSHQMVILGFVGVLYIARCDKKDTEREIKYLKAQIDQLKNSSN